MLALVCAGIPVHDHVVSGDRDHAGTRPGPKPHAAETSWLTNMVQVGFVAGALGSSFVGLPDLLSLRKLVKSGLAAAVANGCLLFSPVGLLLFVPSATGLALAGIRRKLQARRIAGGLR